jgi:hypothetical protein
MSMVMTRQRTANLVKGFAWLSLAAAALPAVDISDDLSGPGNRLTVGLPWSPWLVYRERWVGPAATAETPTLSFETTIEPRSDSTIALLIGVTLLLISRLMRAESRRLRVPGSGFRQQLSSLRH